MEVDDNTVDKYNEIKNFVDYLALWEIKNKSRKSYRAYSQDHVGV